jgi:ADP-heptose:LPS heptosyltransferase
LLWLKKTREIRPDFALDFQGLPHSALIARIAGAKEISGMSSALPGATWLHTRIGEVNRRSHPVDRYLKLAECAAGTAGKSLRYPLSSGDPIAAFRRPPALRPPSPFCPQTGQIALKRSD